MRLQNVLTAVAPKRLVHRLSRPHTVKVQDGSIDGSPTVVWKKISSRFSLAIGEAQCWTRSVSVKFRLDWFLGVLSRYTQAKPDVDIPVNSVIEKLRYAQNIIVQLDKDVYSGYKPEKVYSGCKGRPSFDIPKDQLDMFLEYNFSVPQIAEMLGVSLSTIKRRFRDYDLSVSQTYSAIADNELDEIIQQLVSEFPNCGYRRMTGYMYNDSV